VRDTARERERVGIVLDRVGSRGSTSHPCDNARPVITTVTDVLREAPLQA